MKTYKVFEKSNEKVAVKQGWSWPGFFFLWIWALTKKALLPAGIGFATNVVVALIPVNNSMNPYFLIAGLLFGSVAVETECKTVGLSLLIQSGTATVNGLGRRKI